MADHARKPAALIRQDAGASILVAVLISLRWPSDNEVRGIVECVGCAVLKHSYFWQQAQVCMSLARYCNDPQLKERYEDLALYFVQVAGREQDLDDTFSHLFGVKKPDAGGDTTPSEST
jgi:hypothetical protein